MKLSEIADAEIPPCLRRRPSDPPVVIPADAVSLDEGMFDKLAFTADPVNSRKETAGERSARRRAKDRAYLFVHKVLKKGEAHTIGQLVKASIEAHDEPIPQTALKSALRKLIGEKIIVQDNKWYQWRKS